MNIPMTWHQPGPKASGFFRHVKENSNPLRKALALSILVGALLWTAPLPIWLSIALFMTLSTLALAIALIPGNWPLWIFEPIPQRDRQAMARTVARDMALQFLEEEGRRQIPSDAVLFYTIRSKRLLVRVVDPTGRLNTPRYEGLARSAFEARLCTLARSRRYATAIDMQDPSGDIRVESVPIVQPSNHEILTHRARTAKAFCT